MVLIENSKVNSCTVIIMTVIGPLCLLGYNFFCFLAANHMKFFSVSHKKYYKVIALYAIVFYTSTAKYVAADILQT